MQRDPTIRKLILFGVAIAIPLAAVAFYFAVFDQPPAAVQVSQAATAAAPGGAGGATQPALPPDHPPVGTQPSAGAELPAGHPQMGGSGREVRVPEDVKAKWQAVRLQVERKSGGTSPQVFTVKVGGSVDIPGSTLHVAVRDFLPALQVNGNEVTSAGNTPTNPAALVTVSEGGKEIFKGWLFARFPDMQAFQHPVYRITLLEGVPKG
jgi:hypothetical protein